MYYRGSLKRFLSISLVTIIVLSIGLYLRPVPALKAQSRPLKLSATGQLYVPWPDYGQSAFGAVGYGVLATNNNQKAAPIASIAKLVTALSVLRQKPLQPGQQGPKITFGPADVAIYQKYVAEQGSVVPINDGEQLTEYQALQAMLLPSANNIADSLANWAFGSQKAYLSYANNFVNSLGLSKTYLADASGFSPKSVSSANNLVILGEKTLENPVLADIVSQQTAILPLAGKVYNVNWLLGTDGVDGIKTGNTDQAGGCFLFSAKQSVGGQQIQIVGAILGAPDINSPNQAIDDSQSIIEATPQNFTPLEVAKANQVVGTYKAAWGPSSNAVAASDLTIAAWNGSKPTQLTKLDKVSALASSGQKVGSASVTSSGQTQTVPVLLQQKIAPPSVFWRIFHL